MTTDIPQKQCMPQCASTSNPSNDIRRKITGDIQRAEQRLEKLRECLAFLDSNPGVATAHDKISDILWS